VAAVRAVKVAINLDVLGDTRPLWSDWLDNVSGVIDVRDLPGDRAAAAAELDARGAGNWRSLLERFADDRAPVYLRPAAEVSEVLRELQADGVHVVVFSDAPSELVRVALRQLGAARRVEGIAPDPPSADVVVRTREQLLALRRSA
jgi:phosphoglycolate phosphatase-like HAD superfamily hydrolase